MDQSFFHAFCTDSALTKRINTETNSETTRIVYFRLKFTAKKNIPKSSTDKLCTLFCFIFQILFNDIKSSNHSKVSLLYRFNEVIQFRCLFVSKTHQFSFHGSVFVVRLLFERQVVDEVVSVVDILFKDFDLVQSISQVVLEFRGFGLFLVRNNRKLFDLFG